MSTRQGVLSQTLMAFLIVFFTSEAWAVVMYGGSGGGLTTAKVVTIDQSNADVTVVRGEFELNGLTGLAFDLTGRLFGTSNRFGDNYTGQIPPSAIVNETMQLLEFDPDTGAETPIGKLDRLIRDLAVDPISGQLLGTDGQAIVEIDKTTAAIAPIQTFDGFGAGLAFASDGTLYRTVSYRGAPASTTCGANLRCLETLDLVNGIVTSSVGIENDTFLDGLGIRPTDGEIFATLGGFVDPLEIFTIDSGTGALTSIGTPYDPNHPGVYLLISDLTFRPDGAVVPEPATLLLLSLSLLGVAVCRR